ncbi:hypothetical protein NDU88_001137 [Pleurodeles waltl]|uniref:Uncharacterized protein n=1 Tax=Pleurodeles waltl TaxID=8319 RepID=A0AAV7M289_PLEWA|nr:hypothetical protein NDU88_001137 [Pleurodeles waltl]
MRWHFVRLLPASRHQPGSDWLPAGLPFRRLLSRSFFSSRGWSPHHRPLHSSKARTHWVPVSGLRVTSGPPQTVSGPNPTKSAGTPRRVGQVSPGTRVPGPPQPGPTTTAVTPVGTGSGTTSCSGSCHQAHLHRQRAWALPRLGLRPHRVAQISPRPQCRASTGASAAAEISPYAPGCSVSLRPWPRGAGHLSSSLLQSSGRITDQGRQRHQPQARRATPRGRRVFIGSSPHSTGPRGRPQAPASWGGACPRLCRKVRGNPGPHAASADSCTGGDPSED